MKPQIFTTPHPALLPCPNPSAHDSTFQREHACHLGCESGACETCPCCGAGWCVFGLDGLPSEPDDLSMWLDVAAEHNPVVAAVRAVLDLAMSDNENRALSRSTVVATVRAALAGGTA